MRNKTLIRVILVIPAILCLSSCDTTTPPVSAPSCPPLAGPITSPALTGDVSSVTVPDGTTGEFDGGGYWCTPGDLTVNKVSVNTLIQNHGCFNSRSITTPPCAPYNALAAIDLNPERVKFSSAPQPSLRYDLSVVENQPQCTKDGTNCGGYEFYQLKDPVPATGVAWRPVGHGTAATYGGTSVAQGTVNHFSVFALVELPEPQPQQPPFQAQMIVDSEFMPDEQNAIRVSMEIVDSEMLKIGETRLFRFSRVDPAWSDPNLPKECLGLATPAEQLTCFFPIGTPVTIELGVNNVANLIRIVALDKGYPVELYGDLEIY